MARKGSIDPLRIEGEKKKIMRKNEENVRIYC